MSAMTTSWQLKLVPALLCGTFTTTMVSAATDDHHDIVMHTGSSESNVDALKILLEILELETLEESHLLDEIMSFLGSWAEELPHHLRPILEKAEGENGNALFPSFFEQMNTSGIRQKKFPFKLDTLHNIRVKYWQSGSSENYQSVYRVAKHEWRSENVGLQLVESNTSMGRVMMQFRLKTRKNYTDEWEDYPGTFQCFEYTRNRYNTPVPIVRWYLLELAGVSAELTEFATPKSVEATEHARKNEWDALETLYADWKGPSGWKKLLEG